MIVQLQYNMPNLDDADEAHSPKFKLEYTTFPAGALHPPVAPEVEADGEWEEEEDTEIGTEAEVAARKKKFAYPIPRRHLPRALRNRTVTKSKKYAPYALEDLTVGSWAGLARRLGRAKAKGLRQRFRRFMYMGADEA